MSCYKSLVIENQELRRELMEFTLKIRDLREQFSGRGWITTSEVELALEDIPMEDQWH